MNIKRDASHRRGRRTGQRRNAIRVHLVGVALLLLGALSAVSTPAFLRDTPLDWLGASELAARPENCPPTSSRLIGYRYRTGYYYSGFCITISHWNIECEWCECRYMAFVNGLHWTWITGGQDTGCSLDLPISIEM